MNSLFFGYMEAELAFGTIGHSRGGCVDLLEYRSDKFPQLGRIVDRRHRLSNGHGISFELISLHCSKSHHPPAPLSIVRPNLRGQFSIVRDPLAIVRTDTSP